MKVLVGCEYSGVVRDAFIAKGHDAMSCDLLPTDVEGPHYQGDILDIIHDGWDLIIMHPPCTALAVSGNGTYGEGMHKHHERLESIRWTKTLWDTAIATGAKVCLENPVGVLHTQGGLPKPQYVQPYMFGHMQQKKTGLFLHGLPKLKETNNVYDAMMELPIAERQHMFYLPPTADRWKIRSQTYVGIALAMADQWG